MSDDQLTASEYRDEGERDRRFYSELQDRKLIGTGVLICGPLYLAMVFVAALLSHASLARNLAILDAALCFVSYAVQMIPAGSPDEDSKAEKKLVLSTILVGGAAGVALIFGV